MLLLSFALSKSALFLTPESWRSHPAQVGELDFNPVWSPQDPFGPLPDSLGLIDLRTTLKSILFFDSPQECLNSEPFDLPCGCYISDIYVPKPVYPKSGSPEPLVAGLWANHSLTEGLVLDTMNDSLSKILLDISFPGLEEDVLGPDTIN